MRKSENDVVDLFGGPSALAAELGLVQSAVSNWRMQGKIPGKWHLPLLRLARVRGLALTEDDLSDDKAPSIKRKKPVITLSPDIAEQPKV